MDWYQVVNTPDLEQGDLLLDCPVPTVTKVTFPLPDELTIKVSKLNLIVLTQSCDLIENKVEEVLLAALHTYQDLRSNEKDTNPAVLGKKWRTSVVRGDQPAYSLLPQRTAAPQIDWSLVSFHHLFTLSKQYLREFATNSGPRLRLVSPYKEHLAQAFARYVMRVGLPTPLSDFEKYE